MIAKDPWNAQMQALGRLIRSQRKLADLSLRELSEMTSISNAYLSQIERGLHEPSVRVLRSVADALNISAESLLVQAGLMEEAASARGGTTEAAIRSDSTLTDSQKEALITVYRSFINEGA